MEGIKEKVNKIIATEIKYCEKNGVSKLSTCDYSNWDEVTWNYREDIIDGIRSKGYRVSMEINWGVLDIFTKLKLN